MQMPYYNVCTLFTSDNKLQPLVWYLQDGTLPKDAPTAEKALQQEGQYFLSGNNILYRQSNIGKRAVIQLVVLKTLQTELFHWCHDHFTSGYLVLNKTYERLRSTNFWNNMFADLQRRIKSCVSYAQKKKGCSPFKATFAAHCYFWSMRSYCRKLYVPSSCHKRRKLIRSYYRRPLYKVHRNCRFALNRNHHNHSGVFGQNCTIVPPHRFLTDHGTNFTSKLMAQLCNDFNINKVFTWSYHPQCDGFVEQINEVIMQITAMYVASDQKDWDT